jgi:hypothetical protein
MTTRRRLLVFGLLAAVVLLSIVAALVLWPRPGITRANATRIQVGMTLAEVEAVLGGPPRDEAVNQNVVDLDIVGQGKLLEAIARMSRHHRQWQSDEVRIYVDFFPEGPVTSCAAAPLGDPDSSLFDRVRRRLRL